MILTKGSILCCADKGLFFHLLICFTANNAKGFAMKDLIPIIILRIIQHDFFLIGITINQMTICYDQNQA